jgi:hypothetical protein
VPNGDWRWDRSCHLFADTVEELHVFAQSIGLRRSWFQAGGGIRRLPHYDLTVARRRVAVKAGAIELDRRGAVEKWNELYPRMIRV